MPSEFHSCTTMEIGLGSLKAFEAVARHLSFKAAATELNLSPSAVSHAISKLERDLGALLFDREGNRLELTLDGQTLYRPLEEAFGLIRAGLKAVSARQSHLLRLHSAPSFAAQWLTPRLSDFLARHPGMEVRIAAGTDYSRFTADEFDADIIYGRRDQEGLIAHDLGVELVKPMCCPELAAKIHTIHDLLKVTLIKSTLKKASWDDWFRGNGVQPPETIGMRFDRSFMSIAAACDGIGVCLDSVRLAQRELTSGRLVLPLEGLTKDLEENDHYLVYPKRNAQRPIVIAFTRWLLGEISKTPPGQSLPQVQSVPSASNVNRIPRNLSAISLAPALALKGTKTKRKSKAAEKKRAQR